MIKNFFVNKIVIKPNLKSNDKLDVKYKSVCYNIYLNDNDKDFEYFQFLIEKYNLLMNLYPLYNEEYYLKNNNEHFYLSKIKCDLIGIFENEEILVGNEVNHFYSFDPIGDTIFDFHTTNNLYFYINSAYIFDLIKTNKNIMHKNKFLKELFYPLSLEKIKSINIEHYHNLIDFLYNKNKMTYNFQNYYYDNLKKFLIDKIEAKITETKNVSFIDLLNIISYMEQFFNEYDHFVFCYQIYKNNIFPDTALKEKNVKYLLLTNILKIDDEFKLLLKQLIDRNVGFTKNDNIDYDYYQHHYDDGSMCFYRDNLTKEKILYFFRQYNCNQRHEKSKILKIF